MTKTQSLSEEIYKPRDIIRQFDAWVGNMNDDGSRPEHWTYRLRGATQHFCVSPNGVRFMDGKPKEWIWFPTTSQLVQYLLSAFRNKDASPYITYAEVDEFLKKMGTVILPELYRDFFFYEFDTDNRARFIELIDPVKIDYPDSLHRVITEFWYACQGIDQQYVDLADSDIHQRWSSILDDMSSYMDYLESPIYRDIHVPPVRKDRIMLMRIILEERRKKPFDPDRKPLMV